MIALYANARSLMTQEVDALKDTYDLIVPLPVYAQAIARSDRVLVSVWQEIKAQWLKQTAHCHFLPTSHRQNSIAQADDRLLKDLST
ncbi:MAG: hypothetical protein ACAF41_23060 [Leptolyngbya sp. BL-A-14]